MTDKTTTPLSRRRLFAGAGTAGALAAAAAVLPTVHPEPAAAPADKQADAGKEGYRLTEHVRRYYQTAKV